MCVIVERAIENIKVRKLLSEKRQRKARKTSKGLHSEVCREEVVSEREKEREEKGWCLEREKLGEKKTESLTTLEGREENQNRISPFGLGDPCERGSDTCGGDRPH